MANNNNNCPCPEGYTPDGNGNCVKTSTSTPQVNGVLYTATAGPQNTFYGKFGANFYPNVASVPLPIQYGSNNLLDANNNVLPINANIQNSLWGFNPYTPTPYYGRLNNIGLWTTDPSHGPCFEWIGFSVCINITEPGTYCIGISGDDSCRFSVDGQIIAAIEPVMTYQQPQTWRMEHWHVFPMTLTAGSHVFVFEGKNYSLGVLGSFGAEIYHGTAAQVAGITTTAALSAITIFSTSSLIGQNFNVGEYSGYSCGENCTLNFCGPTPVCECIETIPVPPCCFRLENCNDPQQIIITDTDLSSSIGSVVQLAEEAYPGCWKVTGNIDCVNTVTVTVINTFDDCTTCLSCFLLTNCVDETTIQTTTDLTIYQGQVIQIEGYPDQCWSVTSTQGCTDPVQVVVITPAYETCYACLPKCYVLIDCESKEEPIHTNTDLSQYLGQVIKLEGCPDTCWTVTETLDCTETVCLQPILSVHVDCTACLPPPVPEAPPATLTLRSRAIKPGYDPAGGDAAHVEKVNCSFAEAVYDEMVQKRYGVVVCCDINVSKWDVKKQLLDLKAIYDPEMCKPVCCDAPTCTTASINIFQPAPEVCPAPTESYGVIDVPPVTCYCYGIQVNKNVQYPFDYTATDCSNVPYTGTINDAGRYYICSTTLPEATDPNVTFINTGNCGNLQCANPE